MLSVDGRMAPLVKEQGGLYFRYSDDILLVCPCDKRVELETQLREEMDSVGLALHDGRGKSTVAMFISEEGGTLSCDRQLQYLGFTFDGKCVRVRSQTIVRYMRRMKKAVYREKHVAERRVATGTDPKVRRKLLYNRYTHLGKPLHTPWNAQFPQLCKKGPAGVQDQQDPRADQAPLA